MMSGMKAMRFAALMAATMMSMTTFAQMNDSILTDSTMWFNQTQELSGVVVKGRLPKTRVKGDAMRTRVAGTILEKAGTVSDALSKIPSLETERDGGVKVLGRGDAEVYINGRREAEGTYVMSFVTFSAPQTPDGEHGQVVVRCSTIAVRLHRLAEGIDHLLSCIGFHLLQHLLQVVVTVLFLCKVFGFVQSVSIDEEQFAGDTVQLLTLEVDLRPKADRCVRFYVNELAVEQRRIMSSIAVV